MIWNGLTVLLVAAINTAYGCQFYPPGEYLRFVRVPENLRVGQEVLKVEVHPRNNLNLQPVDKEEDVQYFTYRDVNRTTVSLLLAKSLDDLVDNDQPRNVLKFKLSCDFNDGEDTITSSLSVTVYVEDINDHEPVFIGTPYKVEVDELFPVGLTLYRGIRAMDRDKPNTPNSDVQYAIVAGNDRGKFALESSQQPHLILNRALDYDSGDRDFLLTVTATDRGTPPRSSNTTVRIKVNDNDDLPPKFTKGVYRTRLNEFYPITGSKIHERLSFKLPIFAFDQDLAIDTPIRYDIIAGNERHLFYLDHVNGSLFLEREIDLDTERSLPGNTFVLQIQASQVDNPLKVGVARVEVEIVDLNDNLPEFEVDFYNISIVENLPNGFSVLQIIANDPDQGDNAEFTYQLEDKSGAFTLDSRSGWMTVRDQTILDREKRSTINMKVTAKEKMISVVSEKPSSVMVEVTLLDANDNNPTFIPSNLYDFVINTDAKTSALVGNVHAIDPDEGKNGLVMYSIQRSSNVSQLFGIDSKKGQIFVSSDNLTPGKHLIFVEASDQPLNPSEKRTSLAVVGIDVRDQKGNKDYPEFIGSPYEFWVGANVDIGTSVGQIRVTDVPDKSKLVFDLLHSYHEGEKDLEDNSVLVPFAVEEKSGVITVVDELKKYDRTDYNFEGVVTNEKELSLVTNVTLHVVDPQDERTIFTKAANTPLDFHVRENQPNIVIGKLGFKNNMTNGIKFSIANQKDVTDVIAITSDGTLHTLRSLDRETRDVYRLTVIAEYNKGNILGTGIYQATIYVDDENDNKPTFERSTYEGKIKENAKSGTEVDLNYPIHVSDSDLNENSQFTVTIFGNGSENFRLDRNSGKIQFVGASSPLDRESTEEFNLRLVAKDTGGLYSEANLTIQIEDENDNRPIFNEIEIYPGKGVGVFETGIDGNKVGHFEAKNDTSWRYVLTQAYLRAKRPKQKISPRISIPEDLGVGNSVIRLIAEDKDAGENAVIKYEIISEKCIPHEKSTEPSHLIQYFVIHPSTGEISVAGTLPPESEFKINVSASDIDSLKDFITLRLMVKDVNDHPPVFKKSWYNFDVEEGIYSRRALGKIEATDIDYGTNANISYAIIPNIGYNSPFSISTHTGQVTVDGTLDREIENKYSFTVIARDNPTSDKALSSTVNVEVNVLDINDNPPVFYGYDDLIVNPGVETFSNHQYQEKIPVYYASVAENAPIGTPITRVFANDSDFSGNGNGLILFDIPFRRSKPNLFAVDSKEGIVTTIGKLDFETQKVHNVTILASDLGSPSLSSTALLIVNVIDIPEDSKSVEITNMKNPLFAHRYYEVEVEENVPVPLKLLMLNVSEPYKSHKLKYSIVLPENDNIIKRMFTIDPKNGSLYIIQSPDREERSKYEVVVRLEQYKVGRDMSVVVYPVTNEKLGNLGLNEVKVVVRVTDVNDNAPKFVSYDGRPIVAAIPATASYGYEVTKLQAVDSDLGLNGEVRYQILSRSDETNRRFAIDQRTGQIRAIAHFAKDSGKVYGFDIKATDRRGADDGKSTIANVFVYVLDEQNQLVMVMSIKPTEVEKNMNNITSILYNATGYDIRVRKLEPHSEQNEIENDSTDLYLYAVDPVLNTVIDTSQLESVLLRKQREIEKKLDGAKVLAFSNGGAVDKYSIRNPRVILSTMEIGVIILGCIVFIGVLVTAVCVICVKRKRSSLQSYAKSYASAMGYALGPGSKLGVYPPSFTGDTLNYHETTDMGPTPMGYPSTVSRHDATCPRYGVRSNQYRDKYRNSTNMEKSITSIHSSGHDSGIVDNGNGMHQCQCGHSSSRSSGSSNNSYEDSLQSYPHSRKLRDPTPPAIMHRQMKSMTPTRSAHSFVHEHDHHVHSHQTRRSRNRSITEDIIDNGGLQQIQSLGHIPPAPPGLFMAGPSHLRRSTERLMMVGRMEFKDREIL